MSLNDLDTFQDISRYFKVFQAYIRSFGVGSQLWGILHGAPCSPAGSLCRDHWRAAEKAKEEGQRRERRERSRIFRLTAWQPAMTRVSVFQTQSLNAEFSPVMIVYSSRSKFMIHNENKPKELRKKKRPSLSQSDFLEVLSWAQTWHPQELPGPIFYRGCFYKVADMWRKSDNGGINPQLYEHQKEWGMGRMVKTHPNWGVYPASFQTPVILKLPE